MIIRIKYLWQVLYINVLSKMAYIVVANYVLISDPN